MIVLPFVLLATLSGSAYATPSAARDIDVSITLPLVGEINLARLGNVVQADKNRAAILKHRLHASGHHKRQSAAVDVTNTAVRGLVRLTISTVECLARSILPLK